MTSEKNGEEFSLFVTILIVTFNHGNLLDDAILSAIEQSYFELDLIIIQDYSTKDSYVDRLHIENIIDGYKNRFRFVSIIENEDRLGLVRSLNKAIKNVRTEYLTLLSGDDMLTPFSVEKNMEVLKKNDLRVVAGEVILDKIPINGNINNLLNKSQAVSIEEVNSKISPESRKNISLETLIRGAPFLTTGVIFKIDLLYEHGLFNEDYFILEDHPLIYALIKSGEKLAKHGYPTYIYRIGIGVSSGSNNFFNDYLKDLIRFYKMVIEDNQNVPIVLKNKLFETELSYELNKSIRNRMKIAIMLIKNPAFLFRTFSFKRLMLFIKKFIS